MRNLKKFLALVLAMMMTLSLMVTVNAKDITADFTDADSVTEEFQEAVDVLNGMKVFQGYESGDKFEFQPKGDITRAEVATIVYRLATGDWEGNQAHLYKDYQKFDDVNSSQWFAGYINYCANAEWIAGYGNGKFGPNDKVTGYQAAAMILRAVGYGKNGEFAGTGWQVQVANVTRSKGLLDNVNKTNYANTLNNYATRELVAEILFQAAQIPTVTWTMLNGYNEYPVALPTPATAKNPSLGEINYGLAYVYGIVVDNQETSLSRKYTSLHEVDRNGDYHYSRTGVRGSHIIYRLGMETGLNEYGHAYKVWFDSYGTLNAAETESASTHTVYAAYDEVVKDELVWSNTATHGNKVNTDTAANNLLGGIASELDFAVPAYDAAFGTFQKSDAFGAFVADDDGTASTSPSTLYRLISNSSSGSLDAVISLNVEATKITAVNHNVTGSDKTTSVAYTYGAAANTAIPGAATTYLGTVAATATAPARVHLLNNKLTANSASTLNDFVVHNAIGAIDNTAAAHHLGKLADTATGKVVSFYNPAGFDSLDPDYVILDDGKKIEKSALYEVVANSNSNNNGGETVIPQVWNTTTNDETYDNGTYEFILDADGKYVGARPVVSTDFIYGTYVDYTQETSSSTFNYFLTGIDQNGKQVTIPVTDARIPTPGTGTMDPIPGTSFLGVPYRDTATSINGIGNGVYKAFVINGTKVSNHADDLKVFNGLKVAANTDFENGDAALTIGKTDKTLGSVQTGAATNLYFTEKTKFVLVEGYGTENAKAEVYTGISELMGDAKEVKIYLDEEFDADARDMKHITGTAKMHAMTYLSTSPFIYAETVGVTAKQVDVIYMPKAAVEFAGKSNLYYVGNNTPTLFNAYGNEATQFTMYDAEGNEVKMWIEGDSRAATTANNTIANGNTSAHIIANTCQTPAAQGTDRFFELVPTEDKTISGETIYKIGEINAGIYIAHADTLDANNYPENGTVATNIGDDVGTYVATTKDSQVATIITTGTTAKAFNVGSAKVVNLSGKGDATTLGTRYPGITDLSSLNDSASVNANLKVSVVVSDDNNMIVTTIFVAYDQNNS